MPLLEDLQNKIETYKIEKFEIEDTTIIPDAENSKLTFGNKGLIGEYAFLFTDIRKSSAIIDTYGHEKAAKIYQSFHEINVKVVIANNGSIRSFDGDSIMGVFTGNFKNNDAIKAAMQIQFGVRNILNPTLETNIKCGIGIDYGKILITKVGKGVNANNNDLVWIGKATGYASHLCNQADDSILISNNSYLKLVNDRKFSENINMWGAKTLTLKNKQIINCYESTYHWQI